MRAPRWILIATLIATVGVGACSDSDDGAQSTTSSTLSQQQIQDYMATFTSGPAPGTPVTVAGAPEPCTLMSAEEVEEIVDQKVEAPRPSGAGGNECVWLLPDAPPAAGSVAVEVQKLESVAAATQFFTALRGQWPDIILQKPDVGDEAFWYALGRGGEGQIQSFRVRSGPYVLRIFAYELDQAVAVGNLVVSRLPV